MDPHAASKVAGDDEDFTSDNIEAVREEETRYRRYVQASKLRSGDVLGIFSADVPQVPDAIEDADPTQAKHGNKGDMIHGGPSLEEVPSVEDSDSDFYDEQDDSSPGPVNKDLQHESSFGMWQQVTGATSAAPGMPLPHIKEEDHTGGITPTTSSGSPAGPSVGGADGVADLKLYPALAAAVTTSSAAHEETLLVPLGGQPQDTMQHAAGAADVMSAVQAPQQQQQQQQRLQNGNARSPFSTFSPGFQQGGLHEARTSSHVSGGNAELLDSAGKARRPSDKLGQSLTAEDREKLSSMAPDQPQGRLSTSSPSRQGSTHAMHGKKDQVAHVELLGALPADQQMRLDFKDISSWVEVTGPGKPKKPLKERLRPGNLASACFKPVADTTSAAKNITTSLLKQRKNKTAATPDVEMGLGSSGTAGGSDGKEGGRKLPTPLEGYRQILHDITGGVKPGQVLALMGPSGSGKTSLLSIIGGRAPKQIKLSGGITVNGQKMSKAVRRRIGFVLQDDVLYETLTVHETLKYAGLLRLPKTMPREEKMDRVDAVMQVLGLTKSRDTIIGGYFRRGVSGGERKRVSVGHELLINPAVLLLDEPTSGLDSTTALHLVTLLRELAAGGRAILTTIHQPSSRLYRQLDQVMLLAEGHVMYYGDALKAVDWFDHLGFGLPYGTNLADHILDCAMGEVTYDPTAKGAALNFKPSKAASLSLGTAAGKDKDKDKEGHHHSMHGGHAVRALYNTFETWYATHPEGFTVHSTAPGNASAYSTGNAASRGLSMSRLSSSAITAAMLDSVKLVPCPRRSMQITQNTLDAAGKKLPQEAEGKVAEAAARIAAPAGTDSSSGAVDKAAVSVVVADKDGGGGGGAGAGNAAAVTVARDGAPFWEQVSVLWQRAIKVRRFESLSGQQLFQLIAVAVIAGLLWFQRGQNDDVAGASDVLGLVFFEMLFVAFRSLFSALFTFPNEFRMLSKERPSGMYKLSAYYISRTLADLPIEILMPTLFVVIVYFLGGLRYTAGAFFGNLLAVLLIVLTAQGWGLLIGGVFMDPKTAQVVTTIIILTFMLVGGFYVRDVQVWIDWLKYLSFVYWGQNLLTKIEFRGRTLTDCTKVGPDGGCFVVTDLKGALRLPVDPNQAVYPEVLVLLGMLGLLRWATYVVLRWKTSSNQRTL